MNGTKDIQLNTHLKGVPLFSALSDLQLDMLYKTGVVKRYVRDCVIVQQGGTGDTFYVVVSGRAKVILMNEDGKEIVLSVLKKGDFFGERRINIIASS